MEVVSVIWDYIIPFLVVLTILVFVHELGHYAIARRCGVRVETFSIGFGREIYGWTDSRGTRWKFSLIPFGGYVKMFGEYGGERDGEEARLTEAERAVSFHDKPLHQRAAIVFAGPFANFLFAVIVMAGMFMVIGQPFTPADIQNVVAGSAAEKAGIEPGDILRRIDGVEIERFEQVRRIVQMAPGRRMAVVVERAGRRVELHAIPDAVEQTDRFGNTHSIGRLGVSRSGSDMRFIRYDPATAVWRASVETAVLVGNIFDALGQIIAGTRTTKELGGPIRIAQMSGDVWQEGVVSLLMFIAILSINLGLINLFPVPMLDGGHLLFYVFEAVRGKPIGEKAQEYGFRIGIAMVLALMVFATWNDLVHLEAFDFIYDLIT